MYKFDLLRYIAAALIITLAAGTATDDESETVCASDYALHEMYDGVALVKRSRSGRCNNYNNMLRGGCGCRPGTNRQRDRTSQRRENHDQTPQTMPIEIVRQSGSFVEFIVRDDSPYFASAASDAGFLDLSSDENGNEYNGTRAIVEGSRLRPALTATFEKDVFGQRSCRRVSSPSDEVMRAQCSTMGKFTEVRVYAKFDHIDEDGNNNPSGGGNEGNFRIPKCCPPDSDDDVVDSSSSKLVEFVFVLLCSPTCHDDPIERIDGNEPSSVPSHHLEISEDETYTSSSSSPLRNKPPHSTYEDDATAATNRMGLKVGLMELKGLGFTRFVFANPGVSLGAGLTVASVAALVGISVSV